MARFYARFDSGSNDTKWIAEFDAVIGSGSFNRAYIGNNSASGALLRDGLLASRSLVTTDVYEDLDLVNRDGSKGIYFPPNSPIYSSNNSTFVSWSTAYTSSFDGIKIPTTNTYGNQSPINYSKRPTASVLSSDPLVGPTDPADPVGVAYNTYYSASIAVKTVLDAVKRNGQTITPYSRTGFDPVRTLTSVWHDPDLQYFAWDDFTPGKPPTPDFDVVGQGTSNLTIVITDQDVSALYANDYNPDAPIGFVATIAPALFDPDTCNNVAGGSATLNLTSGSDLLVKAGINALKQGVSAGPFDGPVNPAGSPASSSWTWNHGSQELQWQVVGEGGKSYSYSAYVLYYDPIIQTHVSQSDAYTINCAPGNI